MRSLILCLLACVLTCIASVAIAEPSGVYLAPHLTVGEMLSSVFSKTVSIRGPGFREVVGRISGTGYEVVTAIRGNELTFRFEARYDGQPIQQGVHKRLDDGITDCWNKQCAVNDQTSGTVFNRYLWGNAPQEVHVGTTWAANIAKPWEIGPPGNERVRVLRLDPPNYEITLTREGSGTGASSDDARRSEITIITKTGKKLDAQIVPGEARWSGYTSVREGLIIADEILVERHVRLVTRTGQTFEGEERSYTLENLASDRL
ncbi:MAG: hypothetical protein ACREVO_11970 [Steroidobacteraceae bacterium]